MANGQFSDFYVYVYTIAGRLAYVGKGKGNRAWAHLRKSHNHDLNCALTEAKKRNQNIRVRLISKDLTETEALRIEKRAIFKWYDRICNRSLSNGRSMWEKAHDDSIAMLGRLASEDQVRRQGAVDGQSVERRLEILGLLKQFCLEHILDFEVRQRPAASA